MPHMNLGKMPSDNFPNYLPVMEFDSICISGSEILMHRNRFKKMNCNDWDGISYCVCGKPIFDEGDDMGEGEYCIRDSLLMDARMCLDCFTRFLSLPEVQVRMKLYRHRRFFETRVI